MKQQIPRRSRNTQSTHSNTTTTTEQQNIKKTTDLEQILILASEELVQLSPKQSVQQLFGDQLLINSIGRLSRLVFFQVSPLTQVYVYK